MGAPHRRTIYMASLEAHVDRLHAQLLSIGFFPVDFEKLEPFKGLNSKTAKVSLSKYYPITSYSRFQNSSEHGRRPSARCIAHKIKIAGARAVGEKLNVGKLCSR